MFKHTLGKIGVVDNTTVSVDNGDVVVWITEVVVSVGVMMGVVVCLRLAW